MNVRHSNRPRKTPTKYADDADNSVDDSPRVASTSVGWNEQGLKQFYNAVIKHGGSSWKKVAAACCRPPTMCQRLYEKHHVFLNTINVEHASVMWNYFLSAARDALAADNDGGSSDNPAASTGKRAYSGSDFPTPTKTAKRTPRRSALADGGASDEGVEHRSPSVPNSRSRRLDFDSAAKENPAAAADGDMGGFEGLSGLDVLAAAAATDALEQDQSDAPTRSGSGGMTRRWGSLNIWANGGASVDDLDAAVNGRDADGGEPPNGGARVAASPGRRGYGKLPPVKEEPVEEHRMGDGRSEGDRGAAEHETDDADSGASRDHSQNGATHPEAAPTASSAALRRRPRKSPAERMPASLAQFRSPWLVRENAVAPAAAEAAADPDAATPGPRLGETGQPISELEARLRHCLSMRARRWCMYEFFCSAIDRPFWLTGGMPELLRELGLAKVQRLTKTDWSMIRAAVGTPRRLSDAFLLQERCALHAHRERARSAYDKRHRIEGALLPADVPTQCRVGQHVIARHPVLRSLHDGSVLTVSVDDSHTYIVQFHRNELGVCKVQDVDVMPENPFLNLPALMKADPPQDIILGRTAPPNLLNLMLDDPSLPLPADSGNAGVAPQPPQQSQDADQNDVQMIDEVSALLDRKSALLQELREMNQRAASGEEARDANGRFSDEFQTEYASKVVSIKETSQSLDSACTALKRRVDERMGSNAMVSRTNAASMTNPLSSEEAVSSVALAIVEESRAEAAALVNALITTQRLEIGRSGVLRPDDASKAASESLSLYVDDEMLLNMSIKLTAMFIAIQRCAASGQDGRTVHRALLKLVSELKPASHANTAQYQNITRHMGRLATHLGAR